MQRDVRNDESKKKGRQLLSAKRRFDFVCVVWMCIESFVYLFEWEFDVG